MAGNFAFGTIFRITTVGLTAVTNLTNIGGASLSADSIDVSDHVEYGSGKLDSAVGSATVTWVNVAHSVTGDTNKFLEAWVGQDILIDGELYRIVGFTSDEEIELDRNPGTLSDEDYELIPHRYRQFIQGLRDGGEISIEGNYDYDQATVVVTAFNDDTAGGVKVCQIEYPTTPARFLDFSAVVTAFEPSAPHDDKIPYSATLKITGEVDMT